MSSASTLPAGSRERGPDNIFTPGGPFVIYYEWFAGWRWEYRRGNLLLDESLGSFETREECVADAQAHRRAKESHLRAVAA